MVEEMYQCQHGLPNWGVEGQQLLAESKVAIVGCGGLGSNTATILTRFGIGEIWLFDADRVEKKNLHRQSFFYSDANLNRYKVDALGDFCTKINPNLTTRLFCENIDKINIENSLKEIDLVIDGLDNWKSRYLLNDFCVKKGIPYVYAGVAKTKGMVKTILPIDGFDSNLRDIFGKTCKDREKKVGTKEKTPVILPTILNMVTAIQATEAVKVLTKNYEEVNKNLIIIEGWNLQIQFVKTKVKNI